MDWTGHGLTQDMSPKLTIEGLYDGVTTRELDQLAAETAASLASQHPDYSRFAARICVDDLHRSTKDLSPMSSPTFENTSIPESKKHAPLISEEVFDIIMANADRLNNHIDYTVITITTTSVSRPLSAPTCFAN